MSFVRKYKGKRLLFSDKVQQWFYVIYGINSESEEMDFKKVFPNSADPFDPKF